MAGLRTRQTRWWLTPVTVGVAALLLLGVAACTEDDGTGDDGLTDPAATLDTGDDDGGGFLATETPAGTTEVPTLEATDVPTEEPTETDTPDDGAGTVPTLDELIALVESEAPDLDASGITGLELFGAELLISTTWDGTALDDAELLCSVATGLSLDESVESITVADVDGLTLATCI